MRPERIIRAGRVVANPWTIVGIDGAEPGAAIVPLAQWQGQPDAVGVWLAPDDDPLALRAALDRAAVIGVHFPKSSDGRGYSTAVLLRGRLRYAGELLAFGDVGRDQLSMLRRVGFDAFSLPPHRDPEDAMAGFQDFSLHYQASIDDVQPLFRKRLATRPAP